jgi:putative ABC transport system permease protein
MTRFYRALLRLYPASFRAEYGDEMAAVFAREHAAAGRAGRIGLMLRTLVDEVPNALAVHGAILIQDLRYSARTLNRSRAFAITVVLVTALGVGANTAAFSVADFVLLRPLPFPDPDSLVRLCEGPANGGGWGCMNQLSPANYRDMKAMSASLQSLGAFAGDAVNLVGGGEPRRLASLRVEHEVLPILGVAPIVGRVFERGGSNDVDGVVISYGLWQSQFAANRDVLGRKITLNGSPFTIIGVMPPGFYFPNRDVQLWTLLTFRERDFENRNNTYLEGVGRLKAGVTFEQSRAELSTLAARLAEQYPETNEDTGVSFFRMRDNMSPRYRLMLLSLSGASLCLLLLTCANLANLLLARAAAHERELAVRAALGAGKERLVRQLITQSAVLTVLGGIAGILIAVVTVPLFSSLVPPTLPVDTQPGLDLRVLGVAAFFTALTAFGFGVIPALRAGRTGFAALREGARAGSGRKQRVRAALVTVEVTMSVMLLVTSGLLIRAVWRVQSVGSGFAAENVLTLRTALPRPKYDNPVRRSEFYDRVLTGVRALPGVEHAAFISGLPLVVTGLVTAVEIPGQDARTARNSPVIHRWITPQYFSTMNIPFLRGRDVEDGDAFGRPGVAVVSASFAERYWPGQDPIGKTFGHRGLTRTVVGVVGDVKVRGLERNSEPQIYLPAQQIAEAAPANFDPKDLVIRHAGQGSALVAAVREIVRAADPEQPLSDVRTMEEVLAGDTASRRAQLQVLAVLAAVAVLLSGVGIYGLLAYTVAQRLQEIGVRLALGADPAGMGRMIFADGMRLAAIALIPGVLGAYLAARAMSALLFGVSPGDPAAFAAAVGATLVIAFAGSLVPAIRAVRVSPMSALRAE